MTTKRRPSTTPADKPRKQNAFRVAHEAACERLAACIKERGHCNERLAYLNVEIPQLEQTVAVLTAQMRPRKAGDPTPTTLPLPPVAPAIQSPVRPERSLEGMGSIPAALLPGAPASAILDDDVEDLNDEE